MSVVSEDTQKNQEKKKNWNISFQLRDICRKQYNVIAIPFLSFHIISGTVQSTLCVLFHLYFIATLMEGCYYYHNFPHEQNTAQRG